MGGLEQQSTPLGPIGVHSAEAPPIRMQPLRTAIWLPAIEPASGNPARFMGNNRPHFHAKEWSGKTLYA
jgi:hypothetical protein